ncbi:MAG: hypothetical protein WCX69_00710 [Candidatus Paceibacterota bacterium]
MQFPPEKKSVFKNLFICRKSKVDFGAGAKLLAIFFALAIVFTGFFSTMGNAALSQNSTTPDSFGPSGEGDGEMSIEEAIEIMKKKLAGEFVSSEDLANALLAFTAMLDPAAREAARNSSPQALFEQMVSYVEKKYGKIEYKESNKQLKTDQENEVKKILTEKQKVDLAAAAKKVAELITGKKTEEEKKAEEKTTEKQTKEESSTAIKVIDASSAAEALAQWHNLGMGDLSDPKNLAAYVAAHGEQYRIGAGAGKIEYKGKDGKWYIDTAVENERAGMQGTLDDRDACLDPPNSKGSGGGGGGGGGGGNSTKKDEEPEPVKPVVTNTTSAIQSCDNPVLSVTTNRAAACQYNKSGGFSYGNGTSFNSTGNYTHNTGLSGLTNGTKTYYVVCKDDLTGGVSDALKIEFKVDLSLDPENAPVVTNATSDKQANKTPVLAVTTDRKAECRYKNASFTFASGAVITTPNKYSHSISIASLDDGEHSFYVMCKDIETEAISEEKIITTTLDRITGNEPVITNTTSAYQTVANPWLSLTTTRSATCQYKDSSFAFGTGANFTTTGSTSHKVQLSNISDGQRTYYAACKDTATQVANATSTQMIFTVAATAPKVETITPARQTNNNPIVAVTTDRPAACQYKDSSFTYGVGTALATSDNYSHSASISALADGSYNFYVICRDASNGVLSAAKQIATVLDRSSAADAPVLTNTTNGYQTTNSPALTLTTNPEAICQYKTSSFSYSNGIQFTTDGGTSHSVQLSNLSDGQHTYYVICKGNVSGIASNEGYQIIFTVDTAGNGGNCASLSANDRKNDGNRSYDENIDDNSVYPWQAAEGGTRARFAKVDWFAGYQFTPNKDGRVTQLCGYFDSGKTNKVALINGAYTELATAQVTGNGSWKCVDISPVTIEADERYYVVARIKDNPVYFEYKSGLLPKNSGNVVIDAGVRQTIISENFKSDIVKYDYMIFGLVDVRVTYSQATATGPVIDSASPVGTVTSSSAKIAAQTSQNATCRFGREDVSYSSMDYSLPKESGSTFSQKVCNLEDGNYTFYIRCKSSSGVENSISTPVQFKIAQ